MCLVIQDFKHIYCITRHAENQVFRGVFIMQKNNKEFKTAVAYYRFSSHKQNEQSIEGQRRECEQYAKNNGIKIVKEYIDRGLTAKVDNRPAFQRLVNDSGKGLFDTVVVWKLDRFARNRYDSAHYKSRLRKNGVKVISATEPIPDTPEGILMESLLEGMAEYYSVELAQKLKRGMHESALKCKALGTIPLGYKRGADGRFEIDEAAAPTVRFIFDMFVQGHGNAEIVRALNARGLKTGTGAEFKTNSVYNILQNIRYTGLYKYENVEIPGGMPAIIDIETYNKAQTMKNDNRTSFRRKLEGRTYPLTKKLFCARCGEMMIGISGEGHGGKYYYYHCKNRKRTNGCATRNVRADRIEDAVKSALKNMVLDNDTIISLAEKIYNMNNADRDYSMLDALSSELHEVESGIKNILSAIKSGVISRTLTDELARLETRQAELNFSIQQEKAKVPDVTQEQIECMLYVFREECTSARFDDILFDTFINRVYYDENDLLLWLNYAKKPISDETAAVENAINTAIKEKREQGLSVLSSGGPSRTRT